MLYVGLDVHQRQSSYCILHPDRGQVKQQKVHGGWAKVMDELKKIAEPFSICYEASCGYGHLYEKLSRLAQRVVVAHPGQLRLIFRAKRKHDRADAKKLAMLLLLDQVPAVWVPNQDGRAWRRTIEHRQRLIARRTAAKNSLRSLLRTHAIDAPAGAKLWTRKGRAWLAQLELPHIDEALQRDIHLDQLELLNQQVKRVTRRLNEIGQAHPGVKLLRTIPGIGPRTAEAVMAYIAEPRRFGHNKQVGAYFGIVPCEDSSAAAHRLGHITREGPPTVRKLAIEASWQAIRRSPTVRAYFDRITHGQKDRRKIALVATAHYLLRVMHAMLRDGQAWQEKQKAQPGDQTPRSP